MRNLVQHENSNTGNVRGSTQGIFQRFPLDQVEFGLCGGIFSHSDFNEPLAAVPVQYEGFLLSKAGVGLATKNGEFTIQAAISGQAYVATPILGSISATGSTSDEEWGFEFRVKLDIVSDFALACGFGNPATACPDDDGLVGTVEGVTLLAKDGALTFTANHQDGSSVVVINSSATTAAIAADTYVKLGMRCEQKHDGSGAIIEYYVNGEKVAVISHAIDSTLAAAANGRGFITLNAGAGATTMTVDQATYYAQES